MFAAITACVENSSSIIISQTRRNTCLANAIKKIQHALEDMVEFLWNGNLIPRRENAGVKEKIKRI